MKKWMQYYKAFYTPGHFLALIATTVVATTVIVFTAGKSGADRDIAMLELLSLLCYEDLMLDYFVFNGIGTKHFHFRCDLFFSSYRGGRVLAKASLLDQGRRIFLLLYLLGVDIVAGLIVSGVPDPAHWLNITNSMLLYFAFVTLMLIPGRCIVNWMSYVLIIGGVSLIPFVLFFALLILAPEWDIVVNPHWQLLVFAVLLVADIRLFLLSQKRITRGYEWSRKEKREEEPV